MYILCTVEPLPLPLVRDCGCKALVPVWPKRLLHPDAVVSEVLELFCNSKNMDFYKIPALESFSCSLYSMFFIQIKIKKLPYLPITNFSTFF
jgi:hypothetical protein